MEHNKYDFIINLLEDKKLSPILKDKLLCGTPHSCHQRS